MCPPSSSASGKPPDLAQWIAADRQLQAEIDTAVARLAEGLPAGADLRLARLVAALLEPAWKEHTCFQDEALFPLIARRFGATAETQALLVQLGEEHAHIGARQREATAVLAEVIRRRGGAYDRLDGCLAEVATLRRRHHDAESVLSHLLPSRLHADDEAAISKWIARRPARPFPLNLILALRG